MPDHDPAEAISLAEHRPQTVSQGCIDAMRETLDAAERGEVTEIVMASHRPADGNFCQSASFNDAWRMLGALEYAKLQVLDTIKEGA